MEKKISCAVVRDLLPNYIEKLTSEETNLVMEEHFDSCVECTKERNTMMKSMDHTNKADPQNHKMIHFMKKTKILYLLNGILLSAGILGIIVSSIVDLAVDKGLTWSLIVDVSILYFYACALPFFLSRNHKVIKMTAAATILLLPLLYMIEKVLNQYYMNQPVHWVNLYALPISIIWIVIIWTVIGVRQLTKANLWTMLGIFLLLTAVGSVFTNAIARQISWIEVYTTGYEWINTVTNLSFAFAFLWIGYLRKNKRRQ